MATSRVMWDETYMTTEPLSPLQEALKRVLDLAPSKRDAYDRQLQQRLGTKGKPIYDIMRGKSRNPSAKLLIAIADVMQIEPGPFLVAAGLDMPRSRPIAPAAADDDTVEILALDLSFAMGPGTEIDDYIEETPYRFDLNFIRTFTRSPSDRLRLARGVGESMFPTLVSSDLVWIDSTQRTLNQQDRIWAISLFGAAAIKRLRTIGNGRVLVISDNPAVENQEVNAEDLIIGGRVIRLGRDL